ncbi:MAG: membrane protein [Candidatus Kapaibacterium sp.]|nr:MAG: membrane protein [Candidatus Kapabacteria bacterium]
MSKTTRWIHRAFALVAFVVSLMTYSLTVQPTVPFWDCGEFSAATAWQQVPHPPGAPFFLAVARLMHLVLPINGQPTWDTGIRINFVSVLASAFTIWLLYLTIVKVIEHFRGRRIESTGDALAVCGAALVGALALNFSDTFWFNGVESEVYAMSSLLVQIIVYAMMRWNEEADSVGHERYLLVIAYLIGLSTGVHLLSILAIFSIVYLVYFRLYPQSTRNFLIATGIGLVAFFLVYKVILMWVPTLLAGNLPFKNELREYYIENQTWVRILAVLIVGLIGYGVYYGAKRSKPVVQLVCGGFLLMLLGYTTYTHVLLRANADPPMNENSPKTFRALIAYLGREQYGEAPLLFPRRYDFNDNTKVRNYQKYGKWYGPSSKTVTTKDGQVVSIPVLTRLNYAGEINYLWKYQINHMYIRYFLWNFVGRSSDVQDAGWTFVSSKEADEMNFASGYRDRFPVRFFALPLIVGLIGFFYHLRANRSMWFVYLVMFLMMGVLAAIAQNQQEPQPRERDYFYAGSFMVWCIWIGIGTYAIIEQLAARLKQLPAAAIGTVALLLAVPVNMAIGGWPIHSRAGNYVPFDYSYNILQSCQKDAILFTNGDNDTFPLWYLQDVAGIRRDVRVVNLSLGNTLWYIDQLKNLEPWGAKKVPISFPDAMLRADENSQEALRYRFGPAETVTVPVEPEILRQFTSDTAIINNKKMEWVFTGQLTREQPSAEYLFRVQDLLVRNIIETSRFTRPIYFSTTVGYPRASDVFVGLDRYLRLEGMAYRVCPVPQELSTSFGVGIDEVAVEKCLMTSIPDDVAYTEPHYGFKFRNLNNSGVYYDEPTRNYLDSYRRLFMEYAGYLLQRKSNPDHAAAVLDRMNQVISPDQFPINYIDLQTIAEFYFASGRLEKAQHFARRLLERTTQLINNPGYADYESGARSTVYAPYLYQAEAYAMLGRISDAGRALDSYAAVSNGDPRIPVRRKLLPVWELIAQQKYSQALTQLDQLMMQALSANDEFLQRDVQRLRLDLQLLLKRNQNT